ncbi:hypothetical protein FNV43_RR22101 [Rhamnella rubrinervis]|uniref:Uncharacterized protein n=1 Tax=Rhamnella rubrinervis TaxID=2594499 RepID=A0A8K0DVI2_9ROSA|nr:hypothetical protein FNV43_RR22101 [Rhamnella rubrinervis]
MTSNLESLQKLLLKKAVFVDEETFSKASLISEQARTIKVLEQRVESLERELDAAITAAARARTEKRQAEAAQKAAELHAQELTKELENTSKVFELHLEELRAKQEEISKRDKEIKVLEAIIQTLGGTESQSRNGWLRFEDILCYNSLMGGNSYHDTKKIIQTNYPNINVYIWTASNTRSPRKRLSFRTSMEANPSRPNLKRPFAEDDDGDTSTKPPMQKKVRFPKGKKVRQEDEALVGGRADNQLPSQLANPLLAAKERSLQRSQITTELLIEESRAAGTDVSFAEVAYNDNENFVEDGIQIEPFNLDKEREEGYFDADGNFVEYVNEKEIKDAWLDSVDIAPKYAEKASAVVKDDDDVQELSSKDVAKMKRRIADVLEPGETVLQALRRLKGTSNSRKEKMSAETKLVFDQLTEDAMKLMENGEYNVYHESQEVFDREAEGYESLLRARGEGTSISAGQGYSDSIAGEDIFSGGTDTGIVTSESAKPSSVDEFDMFAEDDQNTTTNPSSNGYNLVSRPYSDGVGQPLSNTSDAHTDSGALQSDYIFDESSGYTSLPSMIH